MSNTEYPYQNLSVDDIAGEEWEDIPGLDGYYLVSNFGRIKRQQFETQYRNGAIYTKPEKILVSQIVKQKNKFKNDITCFLTIRITLKGMRSDYTIARLVYYCFVGKFDLDSSQVVILCKDGDNFNIRPANLVLASKSQKHQRMIKENRYRSHFFDFTEQDRSKQRRAIINKISKEVTQYTLDGKKVQTYKSMAEAGRITGVNVQGIAHAASREGLSAGGFIWRWGAEPAVDVISIREKQKKAHRKKRGHPVTQYDLSGNKIAHYDSITDAAESTGCKPSAIGLVVQGEYKSAKGFFWVKGYGADRIDLSQHKFGRASMAATQSKPVKQFDLDGRHIKTFSSMKEAAKSVGLHSTSIGDVIRGRYRTAGGFKWEPARNI